MHLAAAGMRSNSVRASLVHKAKKTQGGGQQTTRNNLGDLSAAWASQSVAVSLALGVANYVAGTRGAAPKNPGATTALDTASLVVPGVSPYDAPEVFLVTSSTRLLPHALPTRLCASNFLDAMRLVAQSELSMGTLRSVLPQQLGALSAVCNHIVDRTDGVSIWAAWVLLVHMLSDPRLRRMVKHSAISDMEAATANLFQNYARAEVTRRARMGATSAAKRSKGKKGARNKGESEEDDDEEDDDEEDEVGEVTRRARMGATSAAKRSKGKKGARNKGESEEDYGEEDDDEEDEVGEGDDDAALAHMMAQNTNVADAEAKTEAQASRPLPGVDAQAALRSAADKQTLSRSSASARPASGVGPAVGLWTASSTTGRRRSRSDYAAILRPMITQSKSSRPAPPPLETLSRPGARRASARRFNPPSSWTSRAATPSARPRRISGLVVTTAESRVPQDRRRGARRDHDNRLPAATLGVLRSQANDASNTTLHACCPRATPRVQPSTGTQNHHVCRLEPRPCATRRRTMRTRACCRGWPRARCTCTASRRCATSSRRGTILRASSTR